ncbi:hypothetical protein SEVIR_8G192200v4 [Setaria viridis]|uniref:Uncharacterized protein n=1 Tax=Setaria viridis TaxID=4556 RepID=A0A4U6TH19_SETVI|nr:F-box protein At2g14290-like [Setaria viridis]TKW01610.1 hypothetical protein SEVIR_8G192200v2 [Setaria viridis]
MKGAPSPWSEIPPELAGLVLHRLHAHIDRVRFAAVCKQWRSAAQQVPLPPPLPVLALKDGTFYSMPRGEPLHFPGCDGGFVMASGNWLVYNRLHCLLLVDPFSGATMTLPALRSIYPLEESMDMVVVKLIECSPHLIAALFKGGRNFWIAVCQPGDSSWSAAQKLPMGILDIAFYQEKLYALSFLQDLFALDISVDDNTGNPQVALIGRVIKGGYIYLDHNFMRVLYLIESRGSLLMVRRSIFHEHGHGKGQIHTFAEQCEPELAVFEPDFGQSRWTNAMTVGDDQVLFLGTFSRAVCMPLCDSQDKRMWLLDDYRRDHCDGETCSGTGDMRIGKYSCPLPMISWRAHNLCAGAVWLFPSN